MRISRLLPALFALALFGPMEGRADVPIRRPDRPPERDAPPPLKNIDPAWGGIAGVVTNQHTGKPLNGAFIYMTDMDEKKDVKVMVRSDEKGNYRIPKLPPGDYQLVGSWWGLSYEHEVPVHVVNQQMQTLNVALHESPPMPRYRPTNDSFDGWSRCKILTAFREGDGFHLIIDLGSDDLVKVGNEGTILDASGNWRTALSGGQFTVTAIRDAHKADAVSHVRSIGKNTRCAVSTALH